MKKFILLTLFIFLVSCQGDNVETNEPVDVKVQVYNEHSEPIVGFTLYVFDTTPLAGDIGMIIEADANSNTVEFKTLPEITYEFIIKKDDQELIKIFRIFYF